MDKTKEKNQPEQPNLFGEIDDIRTTLNREYIILAEEIEKAQKSQERIEEKLEELQTRRVDVGRALKNLPKEKKERVAKPSKSEIPPPPPNVNT